MLSTSDVFVLPLTTVTYPASHPLAGQGGPVNAYALRHPDGLILVDTGVGHGHPGIDEWYRPVHRPLPDAIAAHGLALADVVAIINTHLHFDHCGQNGRFPKIPIYVQAAEWEVVHQPHYTIPEWVDAPGTTYRHLAGDAEIAPGVHILATPGHTPGHQSVLVLTVDGPVVLAGQAAQSAAEFAEIVRTGEPPSESAPADSAACVASVMRLLTLAPRAIHFSHDDTIWTPAR